MKVNCAVHRCKGLASGARSAHCGICENTWYFCDKHENEVQCRCAFKRASAVARPVTQVSTQKKKLKQTSPIPNCPRIEVSPFTIPPETKTSSWRIGAVGFEYQTGSILLTKSKRKSDKLESKVIVLKSDRGVHAESDCGELEIITEHAVIPTDEETDETILVLLQKQFEVAHRLIGPGGKLHGRIVELELPDNPGTFVLCSHEVSSVVGRLQVSLSLELCRIPMLLECSFFKEQNFVARVSEKHERLREEAPCAFALTCLCYFYKESLALCKPGDTDGPKQNLALMCRTDFHCMYSRLMDSSEKEAFRKAKDLMDGKADLMFPNGYDMEGHEIKPKFSITFGEWLDSIIDPIKTGKAAQSRLKQDLRRLDRAKDLLSPPPFYSCDPSNKFPYAMGKYEDFNGCLIVELRNLPGAMSGLTLMSAWEKTVTLVRELFEKPAEPEQK